MTARKYSILVVDINLTVIYFPELSIGEWIMESSTPRRTSWEMPCVFRSEINLWTSYLQPK